jgi:cation/acetate symporter
MIAAPEMVALSQSATRTLTLSLFLVLVAVTLAITIWASRQTRNATDFYAGGRSFSGFQNGMAIGGDYMSAASFLGIAGLIALNGYDGFLYSIGFLVAWLVALLLVAELMRNSGRYTMSDVLAFRMRQVPVRTAGSISTIVVSIFYLLAQMVGAGALVALLLGIKTGQTWLGMSTDTAKVVTIILIGILMIVYVVVGGMKGTTYVQIVKAFMLMVGAIVLAFLVLLQYKFNLSALLADAAAKSGKAEDFLRPGLRYGKEFAGNTTATLWSKLDLISLGLALVLGTAGLPHVLIRFYTVPNARTARRSVIWAIGIIGVFYLLTLALGFGAAALVGSKNVTAQDPGGNTAAPQLAQQVGRHYFGDFGGSLLLAIIAAVAFATILAVVAGLTLASSSSLAHDLYANVIKRGATTERQEVVVARYSAFVIGAIAIVLGTFARNLNVAFLVAVAFAIAASANLPAILFSLFWKRFNTRGAVWGIYAGLIAAVGVVLLSPVCWGGSSTARPPAKLTATQAKDCGVPANSKAVSNATALFSCTTAAPIPLENPGLISIPIGFIFAVVGAVTSRERDEEKYAELEVRSLTGAGAH